MHVVANAVPKIHAFDPKSGIIDVDAGFQLAKLIATLEGTGWFSPVVPGTQLVTLGGALANDIHGKNHHLRGTFGCHVEGFELLRSDGARLWCNAQSNVELYAATIGGMGLTGYVTRLILRLMPTKAHSVLARTIPFENLAGYFDIAANTAERHEYAVAWIDQLKGGANAGRGLFFLGDHADEEAAQSRRKLTPFVPFTPPTSMLNGLSLKIFNTVYRRAKLRELEPKLTAPNLFFFPLDAVRNWNRLYGPKGLFQHQSVIPEDVARHVIPLMLEATRAAKQASFLTVLKKFGAIQSPGLLSFPRGGHTLTLDFPNRGEKTKHLLDRLDAMVIDAGGAINPYKDARMSPQTFAASFPNWERLEALRDPAFCSDFWARTALKL